MPDRKDDDRGRGGITLEQYAVIADAQTPLVLPPCKLADIRCTGRNVAIESCEHAFALSAT